jgi:ABC-type nitrate/sulfonate/bicarbonate transport system substrate-binding protein
LKIIGETIGDDWMIVSSSDIKTCAELDGHSMGVFAVGSFNDVSVRAYIAQNCPGTKVNILAVGNSAARAAAMLAGKLDASELQVADAVALQLKGGDKFHVLANLQQAVPNLHPSTLIVNSDFLKANPGTAQALLTALIQENRKAADVSYLKTLVLKYVTSIDQSTLDAVLDAYIKAKLFDVNGGLTSDAMNYTLQFFVGAGNIQPGMTVEQVADFGPLNAVLAQIGKK